MSAPPSATYRLQFHHGFTFDDAGCILNYLKELGISDIYASPIFQARSGSTHGYDVVDPSRINPQLGGEERFAGLASQRVKHRLGWIQDLVPNHMAFHPENRRLMDVFEKGRYSPYFRYFDIDWDHPYPGLHGRLQTPFLGKRYGEVLEDKELSLIYDDGRLFLQYFDLRFPLKIESFSRICTYNQDRLRNEMGEENRDYLALSRILQRLDSHNGSVSNRGMAESLNELGDSIRHLYERNPHIRAHIERNLSRINQGSLYPVPFQALDEILKGQVFRLSYWKTAMEEINYRRFFNINDLISLRIEDPAVYKDTHSLVEDYIKRGYFSGLRIDHIDGLYDPARYLRRLRRMAGNRYILVEKILAEGESLPESFPVAGTTGYDWLNQINRTFCREDPKGHWIRLYARFTGMNTPYAEIAADKKRLIIGKNMAGDIDNLARMVKKIADDHRKGRDFTMYGLKRALVEILARFPVYRTYHSPDSIRESDRETIETAVMNASRHIPEMEQECSFVGQCLLMQWDELWDAEIRRTGEKFALKFQQYSGPVMAKGFEDTLLYVYHPLLSLNEVGGDPYHFGWDMQSFHNWNRDRQKHNCQSLNATATHDNKRGEDVRARINVLSEMPKEWERKIRYWHKLNYKYKTKLKDRSAPDDNDEYLLYQTLIGTYPFETDRLSQYHERIKAYLVKAVREAKVHTAWLRPDLDYEQAFTRFFTHIMRPGSEFMRDFLPFQQRIADYGIINSLSQVLLKMTLPGVPDFYQGCELWDFSLVDPDNRRPVDFEYRRSILQHMKKEDGQRRYRECLWKESEKGWIKLYLIWKTLEIRRKFKHVFDEGEYLPLRVAGRQKNSIIAFLRKHESCWIMAAVPRLLTGFMQESLTPAQAEWGDTSILLHPEAPESWTNVMTDGMERFNGRIPAAVIFKSFPVGLFHNA